MGDILTDELFDGKLTTEDIYKTSDDPWQQSIMLCPEKKLMVKFLADYAFKFLKARKLMDIGCGLGSFINLLKNNTFYRNITGIDNSPTAIEKARQLMAPYPEIKFDVIDITNRESLYRINEYKPDILFMSDVTWCITETLPMLKQFLRENYKGKYLLHVLQIPHYQEYTQLISDHESILKFFSFDYVFDGEFFKNKDDDIKSVSYFLAKIK